MTPDMKKRLLEVLSKDDSALTVSDLKLMRARASYLSPEQFARMNRLIKASSIEGLKPVPKKDLQDVSTPELIDDEDTIDVENVVPEGSPVEDGDDLSDDVDPDMPEDSGELEIVDDEEEDVDTTNDEDGEEIDIDSMNLEQLKSVAKELGVKGWHFYKDADSLREKILATYETSNEAKADAEAEDTTESEVV